MPTSKSGFDQSFLDRQKRRLTELRTQMLVVRQGQASEENSTNTQALGSAREYEDDAQKLTDLELQGNLEAIDDEHLSQIERALTKIDDGTYGLSDASGTPIPIERLEAFPEALYTLEEQQSRDAGR